MNEASRKALEAALLMAEGRVANSQQEVEAIERALTEATENREADEKAIIELKAELAEEPEQPPEEPEAPEAPVEDEPVEEDK